MRILLLGALVLGACSTGSDPVDTGDVAGGQVVAGIEYRGETRVMESFPVQLQPVLRVRNTGPARAEVAFPDGCVAQLRVYGTAERAGKPVWDQARVTGCYMAIVEAELAPGETREFSGPTVSAADVLGDSLPSGKTYYFAVRVRPLGTEGLVLPAGSATLAR